VGASEPIGKVQLGCDAKGPELRHWCQFLWSSFGRNLWIKILNFKLKIRNIFRILLRFDPLNKKWVIICRICLHITVIFGFNFIHNSSFEKFNKRNIFGRNWCNKSTPGPRCWQHPGGQWPSGTPWKKLKVSMRAKLLLTCMPVKQFRESKL
jgi:hypothetical protein